MEWREVDERAVAEGVDPDDALEKLQEASPVSSLFGLLTPEHDDKDFDFTGEEEDEDRILCCMLGASAWRLLWKHGGSCGMDVDGEAATPEELDAPPASVPGT